MGRWFESSPRSQKKSPTLVVGFFFCPESWIWTRLARRIWFDIQTRPRKAAGLTRSWCRIYPSNPAPGAKIYKSPLWWLLYFGTSAAGFDPATRQCIGDRSRSSITDWQSSFFCQTAICRDRETWCFATRSNNPVNSAWVSRMPEPKEMSRAFMFGSFLFMPVEGSNWEVL